MIAPRPDIHRWLENRLYVTRSRPDITTRLPGARTRFTRGIQSYHTTGHHRDSLNYTKLGYRGCNTLLEAHQATTRHASTRALEHCCIEIRMPRRPKHPTNPTFSESSRSGDTVSAIKHARAPSTARTRPWHRCKQQCAPKAHEKCSVQSAASGPIKRAAPGFRLACSQGMVGD